MAGRVASRLDDPRRPRPCGRLPSRQAAVRRPLAHHQHRRPSRYRRHQRVWQVDVDARDERRRPARERHGADGQRRARRRARPGTSAHGRHRSRGGRRRLGIRRRPRPSRDGRPSRHPRRSPLRWPGQAGRPGAGAHRRVRPADPRRADQPPRHRRDRVARGATRRVLRRPRDGHPRPSRARPGDEPRARTRPGPGLSPRRRLRRVSRGQGRSCRGRRQGRVRPQESRAHRAGMVATRRPGADLQAEGPHRHRHGAGRGQGAGGGPNRRPPASLRHAAPRRSGRRTARHRPPLRRRPALALPRRRAPLGPSRAARDRRPQRNRQVDAARDHRRPARTGGRHDQTRPDGDGRLLRPARS